MASAFMGYVRAYLPLLAAFVLLFTAVWAYNSFAPHTLSPVENWQQIENKWKDQRDAARARVQEAAANKDVAGQIAAYKDLAAYTQGWVNDLPAVDGWNDSKHTVEENQTTAADMLAFKQAGGNLVTVINMVTSAGTLEALQQNAADLVAADQQFSNDYRICQSDILLANDLVTPVATLNVPTAPPSAEVSPSAGASASAQASASASAGSTESASPSAAATATPSISPAPSASAG
jgi:hypothetical protein